MLRCVSEWLDGILFPHGVNCAVCGDVRRASEGDCLCDICREKLEKLRVPPETCERCLSVVRTGERCTLCSSPLMQHIDRVYAPYHYHNAVAKIIQDFKFESCNDMLPFLCDRMVESLKTRDFDYVLPVPLHPARERERGVNQAFLLAQGIADRLGIDAINPLRRLRYTRPQTTLDQAKRRDNVHGAFACMEDMTSKNVLLIDDVRTVGATAAACAAALSENHAKSISLLVAAVVLYPAERRKA